MPKRARDEAQGSIGKRQRRRPPHSARAASDQGGVVAFNDAWSWLKKAGCYCKPPPRRSLDPRYRYRMVMQTARKASITFLARLLFFDTLQHRKVRGLLV
ncbi:hypothetical protein PI125_g15899 [Phytophthora idaei]|nr:hypothetical protein PI125_g15899 [Phytophthora idaei]